VQIHLINLDRRVDRLAEFTRVNAHVAAIERVAAVDGSTVDRQRLVDSGTIASDLAYTQGAIGCALSHMGLWRKAVAHAQPITIAEDDAVLHLQFDSLAVGLISTLPADWDLVLWGWNFDSILAFDLLPGISPCVARFDQNQLRNATAKFQTRALSPRAYRLLRAFGSVCYSVSPAGANKLLTQSLPIRPMTVAFPTVDPAFPNLGIDIVMNAAYSHIAAFVSFPPLVVTCNDRAISTVQTG
jgi:GR25 family glycosyltransferase involved in LPS biosynthesis